MFQDKKGGGGKERTISFAGFFSGFLGPNLGGLRGGGGKKGGGSSN